MRFVLFGFICDHSVALRNSGQNVSNYCKSSCHEDTSKFFATNAPDPAHWTLNTCFGVFRTICMHLGSLGCLTKLSAKLAELVQKFVPRSRIGNSCFGEFRTIWVHLGRFGCLKKLGAKRSELVQNFVPRNRIRIFRNECTQSTPLDPKLIFWCVSYRLGAIGTVRLPYEARCKTGRTSAKVYAMKSH